MWRWLASLIQTKFASPKWSRRGQRRVWHCGRARRLFWISRRCWVLLLTLSSMSDPALDETKPQAVFIGVPPNVHGEIGILPTFYNANLASREGLRRQGSRYVYRETNRNRRSVVCGRAERCFCRFPISHSFCGIHVTLSQRQNFVLILSHSGSRRLHQKPSRDEWI